jgi:hypothetical protein
LFAFPAHTARLPLLYNSIGYEADFDTRQVTLGERTVSLDRVNTIIVDNVDGPAPRQISTTRWTDPRLPLVGDVNVALARRSGAFLADLGCSTPMPPPPAGVRQLPIITVCERLRSK